jgi:hypothetical protein
MEWYFHLILNESAILVMLFTDNNSEIGDAGLMFIGTGCDEITPPCDNVVTTTEQLDFGSTYFESWRVEDGSGILRFTFPDKTIFFICTDRTINFKMTFINRDDDPVYNDVPQARLIWKYAPPKGKAVLMGGGTFYSLTALIIDSDATIWENQISLAYCEGAFGGYFIPGFEIKIPTRGNQSSDYNYFRNRLNELDYEVTFHMIH